MKISAEDLNNNMAQCSGTTAYHKLTFGNLQSTDGIAMVAKQAGAFWLVDAIASYQSKYGKIVPFQIWKLAVKDNKAVLTMESNEEELVKQEIGYTDFPSGNWDFYLSNNVLMLPSED